MTARTPLTLRTRTTAALSIGLGVALLAAGCGGSTDDSRKVVVDGSSTVFRISRKAQLAFDKERPDIQVNVGNHGTGGGFDRYLRGEVDVIDASRDAKPTEESRAKEAGLEWTRFVVGYDGITVVVNPANRAVGALSVDQLRKLYAVDSTATRWSDLDPSWPAEEFVLYAPDTASGTFEFFREEILGKDSPMEQRRGVQPSPDDNVLVQGVAGDEDAIGYFGFAYYEANEDKLKAVAVKDGPDAEPVTPSRETILAGEYRPLSRPLYIFVKNEALGRPAVADFVKFYLADAGRFAEAAGYVPPTEADVAANASALEAALGRAAGRGPTAPAAAGGASGEAAE